MPLNEIFLHHGDPLRAIAAKLDVRTACKLKEVNSFCRVWVRSLLSSRYGEIIHAFPWMSLPEPIDVWFNSERLFSRIEQWKLGKDHIIVKARVQSLGESRTFTIPMYISQMEEFETHVFPPDFDMYADDGVPELNVLGIDEITTMVDAFAIRDPLARRETVHSFDYSNEVSFVISQEHAPCALTVWSKTDNRLLRRINSISNCVPNVLHQPGGVWVVNHFSNRIFHFGHRADKVFNNHAGGRVWSALLLAEAGFVSRAMAHLRVRLDDINTEFESRGETLLTAFVQKTSKFNRPGFKKGMHLLLQAKANINTTDISGSTALGWPVFDNRIDMVRIMLENGATQSKEMVYDVCEKAGQSRNPERCRQVLDLILEHGADIDERDIVGKTTLMYLVMKDDIDTVEHMLLRKADPNIVFEGKTALDILESEIEFPRGSIAVRIAELLRAAMKK